MLEGSGCFIDCFQGVETQPTGVAQRWTLGRAFKVNVKLSRDMKLIFFVRIVFIKFHLNYRLFMIYSHLKSLWETPVLLRLWHNCIIRWQQCIKSERYRPRASVDVRIKHQNGEYKCNLSEFDCCCQAGLSISETPDLLGFSCSTASRVYSTVNSNLVDRKLSYRRESSEENDHTVASPRWSGQNLASRVRIPGPGLPCVNNPGWWSWGCNGVRNVCSADLGPLHTNHSLFIRCSLFE